VAVRGAPQQSVMPVIGLLINGAPDAYAELLAALKFCWAEGKYDRLPELTRDLVRHQALTFNLKGKFHVFPYWVTPRVTEPFGSPHQRGRGGQRTADCSALATTTTALLLGPPAALSRGRPALVLRPNRQLGVDGR
jgi:hypothetical protein